MSKRAKKAEAHGGDERWLITYADLVTLLFALFIVLFASAEPNGDKLARTAQSISEAFNVGILSGSGGAGSLFDEDGGTVAPDFGTVERKEFQLISDELTEAALELQVYEQVQVRLSDEGIVVSLSNNLLFAPASAVMNDDARPLLDRVGATLAGLPNLIRVEGHTDDIPVNSGEFASNWELSMSRATAVLRYLVDTSGATPSRIHAAGYAHFQPVADNATPEGRAQNRRADIVILYSTAAIGSEAGASIPVGEE